MTARDLHVVTGALGYTGQYITRRLLAMGERVRTLTGRSGRESPFGDRVEVFPFSFDDPAALTRSLEGAAALYNTYWIRFPRGEITYEAAITNTRQLIKSAQQAGVKRLVHLSVAKASPDSPLPYFRGKGLLEEDIRRSGLPFAILRPTVIFGTGDILVNNIAYLLRRFPAFTVPGRGDCRLQPVFAEDVAELAVSAGAGSGNVILDAAGPETFTFHELVRLVARAVGSRARIVTLEPRAVLALVKVLGHLVGDVLLTGDEMAGLTASLLVSDQPPTGQTRLSDWLADNATTVGTRYASELGRHYR